MSRKPVPAQPGDSARIEVTFDKPQLLGRLFGEYDQNLVAIENRLGVYIAARGNKVQIEGEASGAARAREVLTGLYNRLVKGQDQQRREGPKRAEAEQRGGPEEPSHAAQGTCLDRKLCFGELHLLTS